MKKRIKSMELSCKLSIFNTILEIIYCGAVIIRDLRIYGSVYVFWLLQDEK